MDAGSPTPPTSSASAGPCSSSASCCSGRSASRICAAGFRTSAPTCSVSAWASWRSRASLPAAARPAGPVQVYELTEWGGELEPAVLALGRWGSCSPSSPRTPRWVLTRWSWRSSRRSIPPKPETSRPATSFSWGGPFRHLSEGGSVRGRAGEAEASMRRSAATRRRSQASSSAGNRLGKALKAGSRGRRAAGRPWRGCSERSA